MLTSSSFKNQGMNQKYDGLNVTKTNPTIIKAQAIKDVTIRLLYGDYIPDIKAELDATLQSKGYIWESVIHEKDAELALQEFRIQKFIEFENSQGRENKEYILPDDDTTVNILDHDVKVMADYFITNDELNTVSVCKIKTGKAAWQYEDTTEAYALGLLGEKMYPGKNVQIEYLYLGDTNEAIERRNADLSYQDTSKYHVINFDDTFKYMAGSKQNEKTEQIRENGCDKGNCAGCPMVNICNYEEPPISVNIAKSVKPIDQIHVTDAQRQIIEFTHGKARVNAGPGSGKTLVVALHIRYLLENGYRPEDIGLFTFTRTGAEEMTARVVNYCAADGILIDPERFTSTTFNSFCQRIIDDHYLELGYGKKPRVIRDAIRYDMVSKILDQFNKVKEWKYVSYRANKNKPSYLNRNSKIALTTAIKLFSMIKANNWTREDNGLIGYEEQSKETIFQLYEEYQIQLKQNNLIEYEDQLNLVNQLFDHDQELFKNEYPFKAVIVDEFQDTDEKQIDLLKKMIDTRAFEHFMAVGDDSQSIFAFRGTTPEFMIHFENYFGEGFTDFNLLENHRSTKKIIDLANDTVLLDTTGMSKELIPTKPEGVVPYIDGFYTKKQEYTWIANKIKSMIDNGTTPSDIAFLACNGYELKEMASALTKLGVPSILMNPIPYKENARVAALTTFFDSFVNGTSQGLMDYKNVLVNGALKGATGEEIQALIDSFSNELSDTPVTLSNFKTYAKALDVDEIDECYQAFLENIEWCQDMDECKDFFNAFDIYGDQDKFRREEKYEGVSLITIHSAKGLEWDNVFLSLDELDKATYHRGYSNELFETYRKWFVGITRARENLIMTGQYVLTASKSNYTLNNLLMKGYEMLGKVYGFSPEMYEYTKAQEKLEEVEAARNALSNNNAIQNTTQRDMGQSR